MKGICCDRDSLTRRGIPISLVTCDNVAFSSQGSIASRMLNTTYSEPIRIRLISEISDTIQYDVIVLGAVRQTHRVLAVVL